MKYASIVLASVLALAFASCQKDDVDDFDKGGAVSTLKLKFEVQANDMIELDTRATESVESDIQELIIYLFDQYGRPLKKAAVTDLNMTVSQSYSRTYTGTINVKDGLVEGQESPSVGSNIYLYAVGNPDTRLAEDESTLDQAFKEGRDAFVNLMFVAKELTLEPLGTTVPFTGRASDDGMITVGAEGQVNTYIRLRRPYAKIDFNLHVGNPNVQFEPTSYDLYNLPKACEQHYTGNVLDPQEKNIEYETITDKQFSLANPMYFSFYMLESLQESKNKVTTYHDRDKKAVNADGALIGGFVNAPDNGAYVVIHGKYTEFVANNPATQEGDSSTPSADEGTHKDIKYVGDVSYTIHLGDFSKNDFNNYSVERNHWYTYDVTINGVYNIIVEATDNIENQSGAEGYIIDATESEMIFDLDSHYETVLLRIPLAKIDTQNDTIFIRDQDGLTMRIASPYTEESEGASPGVSDIVRYSELYPATLEDFRDAADGAVPFTYPRTISLLKRSRALDVNWVRYVSQDQGETATPYYQSVASNNQSMNTMDLLLVLGRLLVHIGEDYNKHKADGVSGLTAFEGWPNNVKEYRVGGLPKFGFKGAVDRTGEKDDPNIPAYKIKVKRVENDLVAYLTAYVDEYVYDYHPYTLVNLNVPDQPANWPEYTNTIPRAVYIASSPVTSKDGASTFAPILYTISQKSIGTPFRTDDPNINAYGFESVDETRPTAQHSYLDNTNGSDLDGYNNYITLLRQTTTPVTFGTSRWDQYVDFGITSNTYAGQRPDKINNMMKLEYASFLCLQRNRDKNGNGIIDEEEIEWYLPAVNQYMSMWVGSEGVQTSARLFDNSTTAAAANRAQYNSLPHMYTSSGNNKRVYWAIEGASYGRYGYTGGSDGFMAERHGVRCARNLMDADVSPSYSSVLEVGPNKETIYNLANLSPTAVRSTATFMAGEYGPHHERQIQNKPAVRFQLAKADLTLPARNIYNLPSLKAPQMGDASVVKKDHTVPASPQLHGTVERIWQNYYTLTVTIDDTRNLMYIVTNQPTQPVVGSDGTLANGYGTVINNKRWTVSQNNNDTHTYYVWGYDSSDGSYTAMTSVQLNATGLNNNGDSREAPVVTTPANTHEDLYFKMASLLPLITKEDMGADIHLECGDNTRILYGISVGATDAYQQIEFVEDPNGGYITNRPILATSDSPIKIRARYYFSKADYDSYASNPVIFNKNESGEWIRDPESGKDTPRGVESASEVSTFDSNYAAVSDELCAKYYSENGNADLGLWRVPNQRELAVIMLRGTGETSLTPNASYFSRTTFSNTNVGRTLFYFNGTYIQLVTDNSVDDADQVAPVRGGRIRCVRDVEPKEIGRTTQEYDGGYRDGGNLTK